MSPNDLLLDSGCGCPDRRGVEEDGCEAGFSFDILRWWSMMVVDVERTTKTLWLTNARARENVLLHHRTTHDTL